MVLDWASDLHYFEVNNPLTVIPCDQLLELVCTIPVQRGCDRWCVRISTVGARCVLRNVPTLQTVSSDSPSLSANVRECTTCQCPEEAGEVDSDLDVDSECVSLSHYANMEGRDSL